MKRPFRRAELSLPTREIQPPPRADYKRTWEAVSGDVDTAKVAVAGYSDEEKFRAMGVTTVELLLGTTGLGPEDVVLEIGAGVGRVGPAIAPLVRRWIAADVSPNMLRHARERCQGLENVEFVELNGWDLAPLEAESVDLVYCTVVFMHLDEWERFAYVREAMRILRPGGRVYVDNFNLLGDDGWNFFLQMLEGYHPLDRPPNISKSSTPTELETYLVRAGFEQVRVLQDSMFTWAHAVKPRS